MAPVININSLCTLAIYTGIFQSQPVVLYGPFCSHYLLSSGWVVGALVLWQLVDHVAHLCRVRVHCTGSGWMAAARLWTPHRVQQHQAQPSLPRHLYWIDEGYYSCIMLLLWHCVQWLLWHYVICGLNVLVLGEYSLFYPQGVSSFWWNYRHFQHHAKPNVVSKKWIASKCTKLSDWNAS